MLWLLLSLTFYLSSFGSSLSDFRPAGADCDQEKSYNYYKICYSNEHRQSLWTLHTLTVESVNGKIKRINEYKKDYDLEKPVDPNDYRRSGFNRGHLVPAGDMKLNFTSMIETFYMSNMSPQNPSFNSGIWRRLENHVRSLVRRHGDAIVITAPLIHSSDPKIPSGVTVPHKFFKIVYFKESALMMSFLIPNVSQNGVSIFEYQHSVDEIELATGLDFFSNLNDKLEDKLESMN